MEKQFTAELKKVRGTEGILFKLATAAVDKPDQVVRRALFPGDRGADTARAGGRGEGEREGVQSQGLHHAAVLVQLVLPADAAAALLARYADADGKTRFYDASDTMMLALHLLQSSLVHVDTLLLQQVAEAKWARS